ncbi:MAG: cob(I)yrinic acid a,c-diamide adenosyltransferase [Lentisphaeria bacterium]|nr:cob(I)yrinic acid a,c-diamide adenosyltransferase [Candidatus Neomarinimicrobiota bacterium]MCF7841763.1 cob(I)yrinic acid a,c-diamide adenosyltransferase [Lentisphaeria bacterium]
MRITRVTTRTGDQGQTRLAGGQMVSKASLRVRAYGEIDELNAFIGLILADDILDETREILTPVQHQLFVVGGELAFAQEDGKNLQSDRVSQMDVEVLEQGVERINATLDPLKEFVLPGGRRSAALCHVARTVCRRAERTIVALNEQEALNPEVIRFVNRLSDLLFVISRAENVRHGVAEVNWSRKHLGHDDGMA